LSAESAKQNSPWFQSGLRLNFRPGGYRGGHSVSPIRGFHPFWNPGLQPLRGLCPGLFYFAPSALGKTFFVENYAALCGTPHSKEIRGIFDLCWLLFVAIGLHLKRIGASEK